MSTTRKAFAPLTADIDDTSLENLARSKGVATMVKTPSHAEEGAQAAAQAPKQAEPIDPELIPTPRSQMKNLNIELPDYVWRELKIRAAHRGTTIKHVIMTSLKSEGFEIRQADMIEDGRRDRL
jgi:hypothetical protein